MPIEACGAALPRAIASREPSICSGSICRLVDEGATAHQFLTTVSSSPKPLLDPGRKGFSAGCAAAMTGSTAESEGQLHPVKRPECDPVPPCPPSRGGRCTGSF